jgi:DNA-directed RNA polymerase specialized sigma24 family protein
MERANFEKLFRDNFVPLTNIANSFVKDHDTACDIEQHVFIKLWNNIDKIEIKSSGR